MNETIQYTVSLTPVITSVSPRWGSVEGNTPITFKGSNLSTNIEDYNILIDEIECLVTEATEDTISCTTQARTGLYESDPTLEVWLEGRGRATTDGVVYRYVSLWS